MTKWPLINVSKDNTSWIVHDVTPVTQGTRHSLVGWVNGPNFK